MGAKSIVESLKKEKKVGAKLVADGLKTVLANSYALYVKTQNYHWNVEGSNFSSLHLLFEQQYQELAIAIDALAEYVRACGDKVPATFEFYQSSAKIGAGNPALNSDRMVKELADDQEKIINILKLVLDDCQKAKDEVAVNLIVERLTVHHKNAWMLKSTLG